MEKKSYIKPGIEAYEVTPTEIISTSEFNNGGGGDPWGGRVKLFRFDISDDDSDDE